MKLAALFLVTLISLKAGADFYDPMPGGPDYRPHPPGHGSPPGHGHPPGHPPGHGWPPPGHGNPPPHGHPGPWPGPQPGSDTCNNFYEGSYSVDGGPLQVSLRRFGPQVDVYVTFQGNTWYTIGNCDARGVSFDLQGYQHDGQFSYDRWGVNGMYGTEYINGQPYQQFSLQRR